MEQKSLAHNDIFRRHEMLDLAALDSLEVEIREDGAVVWINTASGCLARFSGIKRLTVIDGRKSKE